MTTSHHFFTEQPAEIEHLDWARHLAGHQDSDHAVQKHQMTLVGYRPMLREEIHQLSVELGVGYHEGLV